ncbi:16S rRNA (uracil(1498)-N(3))-methyltransferase [Fictibacillus aquaticus]|uniref:Ribosomal RNA small subunit methyltransferase E n=1 Tax=Fictibacillus aquaticus TaxID=2021314 RepID=A0A235FAD4_9BACL|nr:16S rRNA (uracil(1498)-N(3))-methyltransferase [Fictibacillus aquaticus]OYD58310.1 16S rRNA (uracil(1498)-N(3))-methyltransferase [Fictibacillus aquaticus]
MQRYFIKPEQKTGVHITITGDDASHIARVMRMAPGDKVVCSDNSGMSMVCELIDVTPQQAECKVLETYEDRSSLPVSVCIAQGLPKGDKLDMIVQKGTELGASSFFPFSSSRAIVKWDEKKGAKKIERLGKIAKEAAEQAHRSVVPAVHSPGSFQDLLNMAEQYTIKIAAYEESAKSSEHSLFAAALSNASPGDSILCAVGPEGGLSEREAAALESHGFLLCGLGPRILRTETASLYMLSAISYHFELMG